jgi:hypothetical protein
VPEPSLNALSQLVRAFDPSRGSLANVGPVEQPVLYVYGSNHVGAFVNEDVKSRMPLFVKGPFETSGLDAGHWLIQDEEETVVNHLMEHLERNPGAVAPSPLPRGPVFTRRKDHSPRRLRARGIVLS